MSNNPSDKSATVTVAVDFHLVLDGEHTLGLLAEANGDVMPGQLVLATDGEVVVPAIVDEVDAAAGTILLAVLWEAGPSTSDPGTANLRLSALPLEVREKALWIMLRASHDRIARLRSELEQARQDACAPSSHHHNPGDEVLVDLDAEPQDLADAWVSREYRIGPEPDREKQALVNALWIATTRIKALENRDG